MDHRKLLKASLTVTLRIRSGVPDKYVNHLSSEELQELDAVVGEILKEDPRIMHPSSHPYVGSAQHIKDCERVAAKDQA